MTRRFPRVLIVAALVGGVLAVLGWEERRKDEAPPSPSASGVSLSVPGLLDEGERRLRSRAGVVLHAATGEVLVGENAFEPVPIASLAKLMGAMVVLDRAVDLDAEQTIDAREFGVGGNLRIAPNHETVTNRDLLYASVTGSANNAARALARSAGIPEEAFVREMNRKAVALGLESMTFVDPAGLSPRNVGSAYDVARLAAVALTEYPLIRDAASRERYVLTTRNTGREHVIKHPTTLFGRSPGAFAAAKTGYLHESLYTLVLVRETSQGLLVVVTLGHPSKEGGEDEALALLDEARGRVAGVSGVSGP